MLGRRGEDCSPIPPEPRLPKVFLRLVLGSCPSGTSECSRWWLLLGPGPEQDFNIQLQPLGVKSGEQTLGSGLGDVGFGLK